MIVLHLPLVKLNSMSSKISQPIYLGQHYFGLDTKNFIISPVNIDIVENKHGDSTNISAGDEKSIFCLARFGEHQVLFNAPADKIVETLKALVEKNSPEAHDILKKYAVRETDLHPFKHQGPARPFGTASIRGH